MATVPALVNIRPYPSLNGTAFPTARAPMAASETFCPGELIFINSSGLAASYPRDGTQSLIADNSSTGLVTGVAATGPGAAASAARPWSRAYNNPDTGTTYATGDFIYYYPTGPGRLFMAPLLVAGGASGVSSAATDASRAIIYEITYESASTPDAGWGVEITAGSAATDLLARVWEIYDLNFNPLAYGASNGAYAVFEIVNNVQ